MHERSLRWALLFVTVVVLVVAGKSSIEYLALGRGLRYIDRSAPALRARSLRLRMRRHAIVAISPTHCLLHDF